MTDTESTPQFHDWYRVITHTSTSFMTGTGLKKCSPPNLSFLCTALAISVMDKEEVLEAKRVELRGGARRGGRGGEGRERRGKWRV